MISFRRKTNGQNRHTSRTRSIRRRVCATIGIGVVLALPASGELAFADSAPTPARPACAPDQFCYWADADYHGKPQVLDLTSATSSTCVPLPDGAEARSFVNNRAREITLYEGDHCSSEGDFRTYPEATEVPAAPFVVRAVEIWN